MLFSEIFEQFNRRHTTYGNIGFSFGNEKNRELLHPLFVITQYIIDTFIENGNRRIAVILPDDDCNILPLILAKCFANIQDDPDFAGSVLDEVQPGQMLRLGDAVVKYLGCEDGNKIVYSVGRTPLTTQTMTCPIREYHNFFEKCTGAVSSWNTYVRAKKKIDDMIKAGNNNELNSIKLKRTTIKKTTLLLSAKNDFRDFMDQVRINDYLADDIITYGEFDLASDNKFALFNTGKLDCFPAITVTARVDEMSDALNCAEIADKTGIIYSTIDKFDELISNEEAFKSCLRKKIPFVAFVPESAFERIGYLNSLGFKIWHWKPATLQSEIFLQDASNKRKSCIFGSLSDKVSHAAVARYSTVSCNSGFLKNDYILIKKMADSAVDYDDKIRQIIRKLRAFINLIASICYIDSELIDELRLKLQELREDWSSVSKYFVQHDIYTEIETVLKSFEDFVFNPNSGKCDGVCQFIESCSENCNSFLILVSNKCPNIIQTQQFFAGRFPNLFIKILSISDFYSRQEIERTNVDTLVVMAFDKKEYIRIKQSYCYDKLVYVLYDYENKWRSGLINQIDKFIPYESVKENALKLGISGRDLSEQSFDAETKANEDNIDHEISNYDLDNYIMRCTLTSSALPEDSTEAIECIPVLLSGESIAYFYPNHDVIDITSLLAGDRDCPHKKDAIRLRKGDKILIRQSDRDIIREKADLLIQKNEKEDIRQFASLWCSLLQGYAAGRTVSQVRDALIQQGAECTFQQVRYWLSGETILPRDKSVMIAIGIMCSAIPELADASSWYIDKLDFLIGCGKKVQSYHQTAGRMVTRALTDKVQEIKAIAKTPLMSGSIDEIGDVRIYIVEDVLDKTLIERNKINRVEVL